jgi:hypothetical protein
MMIAEDPMSMKPANLHALLFMAICITAAPATIATSQTTALNAAGSVPVSTRFQKMIGTWNVQQRMWPSSDAAAVSLPSAIAHRRLMTGGFLEEVMELPSGSKQELFTRVAYFNYNSVNQQYEYFSLDSRAPQMMNEKSYGDGIPEDGENQGAVTLDGGMFLAPAWGSAKNAAFRYRLKIEQVEKDRDVVRLYLTPLSAESAKEFLAFEYVYTRQR